MNNSQKTKQKKLTQSSIKSFLSTSSSENKSPIRFKTRNKNVFLKDLCDEDKRKIADMITTISRLTREKDELTERMDKMRNEFEAKIEELKQENFELNNKSFDLQKRVEQSVTLVKAYQNKLNVVQEQMKQQSLIQQQQIKEIDKLKDLLQEAEIENQKLRLEIVKSQIPLSTVSTQTDPWIPNTELQSLSEELIPVKQCSEHCLTSTKQVQTSFDEETNPENNLIDKSFSKKQKNDDIKVSPVRYHSEESSNESSSSIDSANKKTKTQSVQTMTETEVNVLPTVEDSLLDLVQHLEEQQHSIIIQRNSLASVITSTESLFT